MGQHTVFSDSQQLPSPPLSPKRPLANGIQPSPKRAKLASDDEDDDAASTQSTGKRKDRKQARKAQAELLKTARTQLPIWTGQDAILKAIDEHDTVVILGETGSGKTTQVPQFLLNHQTPCARPRIAVTQPRRVAATSLARRVAEEVGCKLGNLVGYTVRFDDTSSPNTRLKFVTDGTLLQEMLSDRLLSSYDIVIVDEAHERTLRTDMILGFLKQHQRARNLPDAQAKPDEPLRKLKVVVMSATLDAKRFSAFFDDAPILYIKGRQHVVKMNYTKETVTDYCEAALKAVFQIHCGRPPGDVLVFLSGEEEIENLAREIELYATSLPERSDKIAVHKLYAKLPPNIQAQAFVKAPPRTRKVIVSTNIAETSVTIPGIKYVIDTGMMKEKRFHSSVALESLLIRPISKSSAQQRAGRAGRESDGQCYRLYSQAGFAEFEDAQQPEIQRCELDFALLHLLAAGQQDVTAFEYMDRPDDEAIRGALITLLGLQAIEANQALTADGKLMAKFPLAPAISRILLSSFALGCPREVTSLLVLLDSADKLLSVPVAAREAANEARQRYVHRSGDHLTLLRLLDGYETTLATGGEAEANRWLKDVSIAKRTMAGVIEARKQLRERCEREGLDWKAGVGLEDGAERILQACMTGLHLSTALLQPDGTYHRTQGRTPIRIHPSSVMTGKRPRLIIFTELVFTTSVFARTVSEAQPAWLKEHGGAVFGRRSDG